jgi:RNA polymerase sigma-70 factor, ECF subfamily
VSRDNDSKGGSASEPDSAELEGLLTRCAAKDAAALELLYVRVAPILLAVLMRMLRHRDRAEDVLQDVFVKVWQQAGQFDHIRGRPLPWLISIARYRAIDVQRGTRPTVELAEAGAALESQLQVAAPAEGLEFHGMGAALQRCLEELAAPQRRCLVLAYLEGLTQEEIARKVGQALGTVKSWLRRSLVSLRRCIES